MSATTAHPSFRPNLFDGKVALVTGGTSGLGLATARLLAGLGAEVHAVGLGAEVAAAEPTERVSFGELDVTDAAALSTFFPSLDRLDIVVPAAGISLGPRELEWDSFQRVVS